MYVIAMKPLCLVTPRLKASPFNQSELFIKRQRKTWFVWAAPKRVKGMSVSPQVCLEHLIQARLNHLHLHPCSHAFETIEIQSEKHPSKP